MAALVATRGGAPAAACVAVPRADLPLRPEVRWLLQTAGVDEHALLCSDEADVSTLHTDSVVLVDHNVLQPSLRALESLVSEIVDHHDDAGKHGGAARDIAPLGSCSSLIFEHLHAGAPSLLGESSPLRLCLLGAILLDTGNLTGVAGRCTPRDVAVATALGKGVDTDALYATLFRLRTDQRGFSTPDLLRRDVKVFTFAGWKVAISSIGVPLEELCGRTSDPVDAAMDASSRAGGLDFVVLMTACGEGDEFNREIAVWAPHGGAADAAGVLPRLEAALADHKTLALEQMEPPPEGWPAGRGTCFKQRNLKASRKQIASALAELFGAVVRQKSL